MSSITPSSAWITNPTSISTQGFAADIQKAVQNGSTCKDFQRVAVIAFRWENDSMGVRKLQNQLLDIFKTVYGFETESYTIPITDSQMKLNLHLGKWSLKYTGENILRIIIYAGHAANSVIRGPSWELA